MSNRTWVCFDCRQAVRRPADYDGTAPEVRCPQCGGACEYLGYKIPVPPRRDLRAWQALRKDLARQAAQQVQTHEELTVRRRHDIEKEIAKLRERPDDAERTRLIRRLEQELNDGCRGDQE